jgi:calcium uniporter protein, mitochondrial
MEAIILSIRTVVESSLVYQDDVLILSLVLPSRQETCRFHLKLRSTTVGDLIEEIRAEDAGVEHVHIYDEQGRALAKSFNLDSLLKCPFTIQLNQHRTFLFDPIKNMQVKENPMSDLNRTDGPSTEDTVASLYHALNAMKVYHHNYNQLREEANNLTLRLAPLEEVSSLIPHSIVHGHVV